jgi:hypothetical protein
MILDVSLKLVPNETGTKGTSLENQQAETHPLKTISFYLDFMF